MGFLNNQIEKNRKKITDELGSYLLEGETIENLYVAIVDFICFTDKRVIFADKSGIIAKGDYMVSVPYKNIIGVITGKTGMMSVGNAVGFMTSRSSHTLQLAKDEDLKECYKLLMSKII